MSLKQWTGVALEYTLGKTLAQYKADKERAIYRLFDSIECYDGDDVRPTIYDHKNKVTYYFCPVQRVDY